MDVKTSFAARIERFAKPVLNGGFGVRDFDELLRRHIGVLETRGNGFEKFQHGIHFSGQPPVDAIALDLSTGSDRWETGSFQLKWEETGLRRLVHADGAFATQDI